MDKLTPLLAARGLHLESTEVPRTAWIAAPGPAIATTLPVTEVPVLRPGGALHAFFAGLLPESRRLGVLRRAVKISADDELSLLLAVGEDTIGDVEVVAPQPDGEWRVSPVRHPVPEKAVHRVLQGLADRAELWAPRLSSLPFDKAKTAKLARIVRYRRKRIAPPAPTTTRNRA